MTINAEVADDIEWVKVPKPKRGAEVQPPIADDVWFVVKCENGYVFEHPTCQASCWDWNEGGPWTICAYALLPQRGALQ